MKALVPFQPQLRRLKRWVSPYHDDPSNSKYALEQGLQQIQLLQRAGVDLTGDVLEFGTGWLPIIPLLFYLAGSRSVVLTDVERLLDPHTTAKAKQVVASHLATVARVLGKPEEDLARRLDGDFAPAYLVPWQSRCHPSRSVDIVISRAVLEHIPPSALSNFLGEFVRIVRPGGAMCHVVDNSDHWEHQDKTISRVNFLRYEDGWFWRLACLNRQAYQNRLRHSDYLALFHQHGWTTLIAEGTPDEKCLSDLRTLPLAKRFADRDHRDLAILTSAFVLRHIAATAPAPANELVSQ